MLYWSGIVDGVSNRQMSCAVVEIDSVGEDERAFRMFQRRRANTNSSHWRLEFLETADEMFGGVECFTLPDHSCFLSLLDADKLPTLTIV